MLDLEDYSPLITDELLEGPQAITRIFQPPVAAHLVPINCIELAVSAIKRACNVWGGGRSLIVPVDIGHPIDERWKDIIRRSPVSLFNEYGGVDVSKELGNRYFDDRNSGVPILDAFGKGSRKVDFLSLQCASHVLESDPWYVAYVGILGISFQEPGEISEQFDELGIGWSIYSAVREYAGTGTGDEDLTWRLLQPRSITAARLTMEGLQVQEPNLGLGIPSQSSLAENAHSILRKFGPNVVIVYEPGSVEDLALIWHLRSMFGWPNGFPLAIPMAENVCTQDILMKWHEQGLYRVWGLGGGDVCVTSATVKLSELHKIVEGTPYQVVEHQDLMAHLGEFGLVSDEIAQFKSGKAIVASTGDAERSSDIEGLDRARGRAKTKFLVKDRPLPPSTTMRNPDFSDSYYCGGYVVNSHSRSGSMDIFYPSREEVLSALSKDYGVKFRPSLPGRAASELFKLIGGVDGFNRLTSPAVQELLSSMARGRGSSMVRRHLRNYLGVSAGIQDSDIYDRIEALEMRLNGAMPMPEIENLSSRTFDAIRNASKLQRDAHKIWVDWARRNGLIVAGFEIECSNCRHKQWRPTADLGAEISCLSCGGSISGSIESNVINIKYRSGSVLLRAMDFDSLPHLLAMNFLIKYFEESAIFGVYPGLELVSSSNEVLAEADVVIILNDGRWIIGECKTKSSGLLQSDLDKLAIFGNHVPLAATFVAAMDLSEECGEIWKVNEVIEGVPHFSLTAEHLYELFPKRFYGESALGWRTSYQRFGRNIDAQESDSIFDSYIAKVVEDGSLFRRASWVRSE